MADSITVNGTIATDPRYVKTGEDLEICSFRMVSPQRYFDRKRGEYVEGDPNWYTVTAFRRLAEHAGASLHKGERVLVRGRVRIRDWVDGEKNGRNVEIEADSLGHDLLWGTAVYTRAAAKTVAAPEAPGPDSGSEGTETSGDQDRAAVLDEDAFVPVGAAAF